MGRLQKSKLKEMKVEYKIECPGCGVQYETEKLEEKAVSCMDCGALYLQPIHDVKNDEFFRHAAYKCMKKG